MKIAKRVRNKTLLVLLVAGAVLLAGCNLPPPAQTPVVVYVTPTKEQTGLQTIVTGTDSSGFGSVAINVTPSTPLPTYTQALLTPPTTQPSPTGPTAAYGAVVDTTTKPNAASVNTTTKEPISTLQPTQTATSQSNPTYGAVIGKDYTPGATFTPIASTAVSSPAATSATLTLPAAATAGPSPTPAPVLRRDLMGVQVHAFLTNEGWDTMLNHIHTLGLGWVKVQVQWRDMEPTKGQYSAQYKTLVLALQRARSPQIRTMVSIVKAPDWARPSSARGQEDGPAANPQDFADFVRQLVIDIKPEFLDAVEVWNEPNLIREWHGAPITGAEYMKQFDAAYQAVIDAQKLLPSKLRPDHRITVITAGVAPTGTIPGVTLNDRDWLRQLYDNGLGSYGDDVAIGAHPYAWANPPEALCCNPSPGVTGWYDNPVFYLRNTLADYHEITVRNNDAGRKIWITEFGYATYDGLKKSDGSPATVNENVGWENLINSQQQADYVLRAFQLVQKPPYYDFLGPFMLWNLNFATIPERTDGGFEDAGFSLLDQNYEPRPVYIALQNAPKE